jgi:hypothetical protein
MVIKPDCGNLKKRLQKLITEKYINKTEQVWKATGEIFSGS